MSFGLLDPIVADAKLTFDPEVVEWSLALSAPEEQKPVATLTVKRRRRFSRPLHASWTQVQLASTDQSGRRDAMREMARKLGAERETAKGSAV